jgi:hypothetical protein
VDGVAGGKDGALYGPAAAGDLDEPVDLDRLADEAVGGEQQVAFAVGLGAEDPGARAAVASPVQAT